MSEEIKAEEELVKRSRSKSQAKKDLYPDNPEAYSIKGRLGRGTQATVWYGVVKSGEEVAIKITTLDDTASATDWKRLEAEVKTLRSYQHDNVIELHNVLTILNEIWIVMPVCHVLKGAFRTPAFADGFTDETLLRIIARDVLKGLAHIHEQGHIHRDVKASNVMLTKEGRACLSDFGLVGQLLKSGFRIPRLESVLGTPMFMAPEMLKNEKYDQKVDVYAFGIFLFEIALNTSPFKVLRPIELLKEKLSGGKPSEIFKDVKAKQCSKIFKAIVKHCLAVEAKDRPSTKDLLKNKYFAHILDNPEKEATYVKEHLVKKLPTIASSVDTRETFELDKYTRENSVSMSFDFGDGDHIDKSDIDLDGPSPFQPGGTLSPEKTGTDRVDKGSGKVEEDLSRLDTELDDLPVMRDRERSRLASNQSSGGLPPPSQSPGMPPGDRKSVSADPT